MCTIDSFSVLVANESHIPYIKDILAAIFEASKVPGNSIVMRDPDYLAAKMREGKAVIALHDGEFAGFCYIECWQNEEFVANSGLIVKPEFRGQGLAFRIKELIVKVSREMFPHSYVFGISKSASVVRMNERLGFQHVDYDQLTTDPKFWKGCDTCKYYPELQANNGLRCQCTAMLLRPED